jgi:hypothetical protein
MPKGVVLITGSNGEIGHSLIDRIAAEGRYNVVSLDLTPPPDSLRAKCLESYAGNIMDRYLLDQIAAHHEIEACSTSRRCSRRAASVTPSSRTRSTSRARSTSCGSRRSSRPASGARCASSSRARSPSTACPTLATKRAAGQDRRGPGTCRSRCTAATSSTASTSAATSRALPPARRPVERRPPGFPQRCASPGSSPPTRADRRHERLRPRDAARRREGRAVRVLRGPGRAHPVHGDARRGHRADRAARRRSRERLTRVVYNVGASACRRRRSPSASARPSRAPP